MVPFLKAKVYTIWVHALNPHGSRKGTLKWTLAP